MALDPSEPKGRKQTGLRRAGRRLLKLTNSSQVHLQAVWAVSGHGQVSSCGEAQHSPCSRHPPQPPTPSATTPTFFLCCESSKGCRRRVRRSQALEDGPQLLLRPPGYAERGWIVSSPLALEGPPGLLRPPFPQAAERRGSHRGPHRPGAVAPGLQGPATWPPHVPDNPVHSTFSLGCGPPPPSPRCLPAGPVGEDTNRGRKRGAIQESTLLLLPHPSLPLILL